VSWARPTSLRRRLVLGIMLTAGLALLLALGAFLTMEIASSHASAQRELALLADVLGEGATATLDFGDSHEAKRLLATLRHHRAIEVAVLFDRNGRPMAHYRREDRPDAPLPDSPGGPGTTLQDRRYRLTHPVVHHGETVGTLYLRADLAEVYARLRWGLWLRLPIALLIGGFALLFAVRVGRVVSKPILDLAAAARRVAEHGDTGERVVRDSQDEAGLLVDAFNRMLDELRERQARLMEAQRLAHLGSWVFDPAKGRMEWSEEVFRIFGLEDTRVAPPMQALQQHIHPEDLPAFQAGMRSALAGTEALSLDLRVVRPDGATRWVHLAAASSEGFPRLLRGTCMDITERKSSEAALRQTQKLESLGVLAGGIAHDFNNLLGAMLGNMGLARLTIPEGSKAEAHLAKAEEVAQKAANLTRQMLAYSGKGRFEVKALDLSRLVREMGDLLATSISKKVELRYAMAADLPAILADTSQLQQVVMNLVINASEAMEDREGHILLRTRLEVLRAEDLARIHALQELKPGPYVVLEAEDNGKGMDAATLERIFDPFFTTKLTGRGLGLAAMRGIVEGHRGGIKVYSEVGKGTLFKLYFPSCEAVEESQPRAVASAPFQGSGRVLVVDDEADIRATASGILELMGFEVLQAEDGRHGLEIFQAHRREVRLVLLDLTMPRMDGAECLAALRLLEPSLPVLLTSGFSESECLGALGGQMATGFVQKPYRVETLVAKVTEILEPS